MILKPLPCGFFATYIRISVMKYWNIDAIEMAGFIFNLNQRCGGLSCYRTPYYKMNCFVRIC